jgi:Zn-dependent peptidase ImmA (M78 family)
MRKPDWKELQSHRDWACRQGEEVAETLGCREYPIDPFAVAASEPVIFLKGADLGEKLDGRLSFCRARRKNQKDRFLLAYNTRYDDICPHEGDHCPKVRFTVGHELGHYFLDRHRRYLQRGGQPYSCYTESYCEMLMELEADAFAAGLLMPSRLLAPIINRDVDEQPSLDDIRNVAREFQISLTSMMVRWTRLSDFPCAVFSVAEHHGSIGIRWGWVSDAFANVGAYWRRYGEFRSKDAKGFLGGTPDFSRWQSGSGLGMIGDWVETDHRISVREQYAVIPYARHLLIFLTAPEDELVDCRPEPVY